MLNSPKLPKPLPRFPMFKVKFKILSHQWIINVIHNFQVWCRKQSPEFKAKSKHWKTMWLKLLQKFLLKSLLSPSRIKEWFKNVTMTHQYVMSNNIMSSMKYYVMINSTTFHQIFTDQIWLIRMINYVIHLNKYWLDSEFIPRKSKKSKLRKSDIKFWISIKNNACMRYLSAWMHV